MSALVGNIHDSAGTLRVHVYASRGGVEITSDEKFNLSPLQARVYAAHLQAGAIECERMRENAPASDINLALLGLEHAALASGKTRDEPLIDWIRRVKP